jgi:hypothetical protein
MAEWIQRYMILHGVLELVRGLAHLVIDSPMTALLL